jgi:ACS family hexuronate transporter-like MFS transporter
MFPQKAVASIVGIGGMAGSLCGMMFPVFTGLLLDRFKGQVTTGYSILFSICSCVYIIAFALNHLCAPSFEPVNIEPRTASPSKL